MSFFDDLKKPYVPPTPTPAPQRSRPTIGQLLENEYCVHFANQVLNFIKNTCTWARANGERQVHGYIKWKKYYDPDGRSPVGPNAWHADYSFDFIASQDTPSIIELEEQTYNACCYHVIHLEFNESVTTLLHHFLLKEGFPDGCVRPIEFTYQKIGKEPKFFGYKKVYLQSTQNYGIGIDITW